jgi:hypothetical protein
MKTYKITIQSNKNKNVSETHFLVTSLPKGFLMDILRPLTNYQLLVEEFDKHLAIALSVEGILNIMKDIKLTTKIARNVTEVTEGNLGVFYKRPNLDLNIWTGDSGEVRTYVNNMSWKDLNYMFPEQFKLDLKSKKPFFQGELYLDLIDNRFWKFHYVVKTDKVIYEEIVLND